MRSSVPLTIPTRIELALDRAAAGDVASIHRVVVHLRAARWTGDLIVALRCFSPQHNSSTKNIRIKITITIYKYHNILVKLIVIEILAPLWFGISRPCVPCDVGLSSLSRRATAPAHFEVPMTAHDDAAEPGECVLRRSVGNRTLILKAPHVYIYIYIYLL